MMTLYFDVDPDADVSSLNIAPVSTTATVDSPMIDLGADSYRSDGDGLMDISAAWMGAPLLVGLGLVKKICDCRLS